MRNQIVCLIATYALSITTGLNAQQSASGSREFRDLPALDLPSVTPATAHALLPIPTPSAEIEQIVGTSVDAHSTATSSSQAAPASAPAAPQHMQVMRLAQIGSLPPSADIGVNSASNAILPTPEVNAGMLSTASMIGPIEDASSTFSRVQLQDDFQSSLQIIPVGPRIANNAAPWNAMAYTWTSPVFFHRPLYFEQPNLERYGNGAKRFYQPLLSSAHFFVSAPLVPVKMLHTPPWADVYTLGEARPGNRVPMQTQTLFKE